MVNACSRLLLVVCVCVWSFCVCLWLRLPLMLLRSLAPSCFASEDEEEEPTRQARSWKVDLHASIWYYIRHNHTYMPPTIVRRGSKGAMPPSQTNFMAIIITIFTGTGGASRVSRATATSGYPAISTPPLASCPRLHLHQHHTTTITTTIMPYAVERGTYEKEMTEAIECGGIEPVRQIVEASEVTAREELSMMPQAKKESY